ncbi:ERF family protein, partial [Phenylobacterium sp.]|nr:ERF family protein [Phenylobacterium sp.]
MFDQSPTIAALAKALSAAQGEIEGAVKGKNNPAFRSKYADLSAVWDACREALSKNGLSV